jgi:hypothetical protein
VTGRDLITASLRLIGAVAPGESVSATEATDGLASINRMIDSWSNENLLIYATVRDSLALTSGQQTYTLGTGGTLNTTRPQRIVEAKIESRTSSPYVEYPLRILSLEQWAAIPQKSMTGSIPTDIYADGAYPLENIYIYPVPSSSVYLAIYSLKQLTSIATLDTVVSLPPGYEEALVYNGAVRLSPEYGRPVTPEIAQIAVDSKASVKRMNHRPKYLRVDRGLVRPGRFNFNTGENR